VDQSPAAVPGTSTTECRRRIVAALSDARQRRYRSGLDIYLDVIAAQTALLSNQRTALNLRMQQLTASVQLIKMVGGAWDISHEATAAIP
jgi:outer membrane protein TolC